MIACPHSKMHRAAVATALVFGVLTLFAGGRMLFGLGEAGYAVVQPVLVFNTVMGVVYIAVAVIALRHVDLGRRAALGVVLVNAAVLVALGLIRMRGGTVANETLIAMALRTMVWMGIVFLLARAYPRARE